GRGVRVEELNPVVGTGVWLLLEGVQHTDCIGWIHGAVISSRVILRASRASKITSRRAPSSGCSPGSRTPSGISQYPLSRRRITGWVLPTGRDPSGIAFGWAARGVAVEVRAGWLEYVLPPRWAVGNIH